MFYYRRAASGREHPGGRFYSFWESSMILTRWAATLTLLLVMIAGCQKTMKEEQPVPTTMPTSQDRIESAKARYTALGAMVGDVDATNGNLTAVSGLDPKSITKDDVLTFIDPASDEIISHGTLDQVGPSGHLVITFDPQGKRAPKPGDLCVKLKK